MHYGSFEVTESTGSDFLERGLAARQSKCIILGSKVTHQRCHSIVWTKERESPFEECGFAGAGTGDKAHDEHSGGPKTVAKNPSDDVILLEHILSDFDQTGFGAHSCISKATTSISLPCTISEHGVPHSGQQNNCTERRACCARQLGRTLTTGTSSITRREPCSRVF